VILAQAADQLGHERGVPGGTAGLDLGQHAVQGGLVRQRSRQHSVLSARLTPQGGERKAHHLAQVAAHTDLVLPRLRPAVCAGHVVTGHVRAWTSSV
jgi:hypothetical protein